MANFRDVKAREIKGCAEEADYYRESTKNCFYVQLLFECQFSEKK